jgi:hypothetical protein
MQAVETIFSNSETEFYVSHDSEHMSRFLLETALYLCEKVEDNRKETHFGIIIHAGIDYSRLMTFTETINHRETLLQIMTKQVQTTKELIEFLFSVSELKEKPQFVIIDGMTKIFSHPQPKNFLRSLNFLFNILQSPQFTKMKGTKFVFSAIILGGNVNYATRSIMTTTIIRICQEFKSPILIQPSSSECGANFFKLSIDDCSEKIEVVKMLAYLNESLSVLAKRLKAKIVKLNT